jgi:hypothetical protein
MLDEEQEKDRLGKGKAMGFILCPYTQPYFVREDKHPTRVLHTQSLDEAVHNTPTDREPSFVLRTPSMVSERDTDLATPLSHVSAMLTLQRRDGNVALDHLNLRRLPYITTLSTSFIKATLASKRSESPILSHT